MQKIGDITDTADGNGEFTDGNVAGNVQPTELMAAWFNSVQRELIAVLTAAGIAPDKSNDKQLSEAIQAILSKGISGSGYLISDNNLSDLKDVSEALGHLGLDNVGNWQAVQANGGKHSSGNHHMYIDWDGKKLHYTVDDTDVGEAFTTQNPPTATQTGAYPKTGGNLDEEASISVISNSKNPATGTVIYSPMFRVVLKGRGGDRDFSDGASGFMRLVEEVGTRAYLQLQWDGFSTVHEFRFDQNGNSQVYGKAYTGSGASFLAEDGNVYGAAWGGYATSWVLQQVNALNIAINNQLNNMNADRNNCVRATARGGRQHKVGGDWVGDWEAPGGCRVTGFNTNEGGDGRKMGIYYRADYYYTNASGWVQAGDIA